MLMYMCCPPIWKYPGSEQKWPMGVPSVSIILINAILVYLPLIYKYDTELAKYLPDL